MKESTIEKYLKDKVEALSGYCYKWSSPSNRGVPDRIVFLYGRTYFIELKATDKPLTKLQNIIHKRIKKTGNQTVFVFDSKEKIDAFLERCF